MVSASPAAMAETTAKPLDRSMLFLVDLFTAVSISVKAWWSPRIEALEARVTYVPKE